MRLDFRFTGKAGVKEFWKWCFSVLGISLAMAVIMAVMIAVWGNRIPASPVYEMVSQVLAILFGNFLLVVLFLSLAVASRRLRDAGISPWWLLMPVILCLTSAFVFMDAGLANMSAMPPSVPVVWQVVTYSVTALVGFIFMCLFCKSSKK
ncbi:MAG: DUF805 domain-containing protein [Bacteroidetes bacterium]|nr:DUF805 domain-containing protein [Candidatus Colenecus caballi]